MTFLRRLIDDDSGANAVEFAFVLPLLIAMIVGVIEGNRLLWTRQAIQTAASNAARCMSVGSEGCDTAAGARLYARQRADKMGISVPLSAITVASNQTCHGETGMNRVSFDIAFDSPLETILPVMPARLTTEACFPSLS
jgi:Flp pilus assembly protein TadG